MPFSGLWKEAAKATFELNISISVAATIIEMIIWVFAIVRIFPPSNRYSSVLIIGKGLRPKNLAVYRPLLDGKWKELFSIVY